MTTDTASGFEKLNDSNYEVWSRLMEALLVRKDLWDVVSGDATLPLGSANSAPVRKFRKRQALARAEIILHIKPSQIPFVNHDDPVEIWDQLAAMHRARGMSTRLTFRRKFWKLSKGERTMQGFISEARRLANHLNSIGVTVDEEDIILVLTGGLPASYDHFVVSLDTVPATELTLDNVVTRLLNEESRQLGQTETETSGPSAAKSSGDVAYAANGRLITCYNCGKKGHFARGCTEPKKEKAPANADVAATAVEVIDGVW